MVTTRLVVGFDSLYLASDPITALAEVVAVFQPSHGRIWICEHRRCFIE